jgi:hypothetical protein
MIMIYLITMMTTMTTITMMIKPVQEVWINIFVNN